MDEYDKQATLGRKTFFIAPEQSFLPESYLEDYLAEGYEVYIINDDRYCPLQKKVESIINIFDDSILFFYIDTVVPGINWPVYIKQLQAKYGDTILIGVLYTKRHNDIEKLNLEKYYLYDVGIKCGCIQLEYQKKKNFALIDKVMYANQACGRRKNIRAICDSSSTINFSYNKKNYTGTLSDISLSHFSCVIKDTLGIPLYEKIYDIFIDLNGMHFKTDGILIMERTIHEEHLYVFIFAKADGFQGLDGDVKSRLTDKIYQLVTDKVKSIMQLVFEEVSREDNEVDGVKGHTTFHPQDLKRLL